MEAKLIDILLEKEYPLSEKKAVTIGRNEKNDVVTSSFYKNVSRSQAVIAFNEKENKYVIFDNFSFDGTYVDGTRIDKALLSNGAEITFGKKDKNSCYYKLIFKEEEEKYQK